MSDLIWLSHDWLEITSCLSDNKSAETESSEGGCDGCRDSRCCQSSQSLAVCCGEPVFIATVREVGIAYIRGPYINIPVSNVNCFYPMGENSLPLYINNL